MKPDAIAPAEVDFSDPGSPFAPAFGDRYHPAEGAFEQASHVFLAGNGLPTRWQDRAAFTILETGFGLGNNFLATWAAWRADARRCTRLRFVSIEKHPLRLADLRRALAQTREPTLAAALCNAWPPLTPDVHMLPFDDGRVELLLVLGDAAPRLRELIARVDAFYLDGFAPARNPQMWSSGLFKSLSRLAAPGATAATWSSARAVRDGLQLAGFAPHTAPGIGGKRDITVATFEPRAPQRAPVARRIDATVSHVAIIGGGLAGAACAQALAREGLRCTVVDRLAQPAGAASGNAGGLFHGVFHPEDGPHARAHRAAALAATRAYAEAIAHAVPGRCDGLVRLTPEHADAAPLLAALARSGLPPDYLQAWSPAQVQAAGGPACAAWFYPGGGWISPAALVRHWLQRGLAPQVPDAGLGGSAAAGAAEADGTRSGACGASALVQWRGGCAVRRLERHEDGWHLLDADGDTLAVADAVVLANAADATALWSRATDASGRALAIGDDWIAPLATTRGQVSSVAAGTPGLRTPRHPIAGAGYALTLSDGAVLCGSTTSADDLDASVRPADHDHNLRQLAAVTGSRLPQADALMDSGHLQGRVGWRAATADRLPLIGAVPAPWPADAGAPADQPRHWPRVSGLFVAAGLGSRGLTWAPLAGRLVASWITGAPYPLPADLVDALDPARFATRKVRASRRPG